MVALLICWVMSGTVGALIGRAKGAAVGGFFLGLFLGPIGWLIVAVYKGEAPVMSDPAAAPVERARAVEAQMKSVPKPPRRAMSNLLRVARDGEDMGRMEPHRVCDLITSGELTLQDHFLDESVNQWRTLDQCPAIQIGEPQ